MRYFCSRGIHILIGVISIHRIGDKELHTSSIRYSHNLIILRYPIDGTTSTTNGISSICLIQNLIGSSCLSNKLGRNSCATIRIGLQVIQSFELLVSLILEITSNILFLLVDGNRISIGIKLSLFQKIVLIDTKDIIIE